MDLVYIISCARQLEKGKINIYICDSLFFFTIALLAVKLREKLQWVETAIINTFNQFIYR